MIRSKDKLLDENSRFSSIMFSLVLLIKKVATDIDDLLYGTAILQWFNVQTRSNTSKDV